MFNLNKKLLFSICFLFSTHHVAQAGQLLNQHLPKWVNMDIEFRHRMEYRQDFDFRENVKDNDRYDLLRSRLNLTLTPIKELKIFTQMQDSRIANDSFNSKVAFENYMDVRQLYLNYEDEIIIEQLGVNKISARAGRQEFSYGAQRLLGGFNWSNVAQTFDGGKIGVHIAPIHMQFDVFAGDKTSIKSPREKDDLFDGSSNERVYAYYASAKAFHETLIENYLIRRQSIKNFSFGPAGSGDVDNYTFGGRLKKKFSNGIDYELETAGQWGNFKDKKVAAMMGVVILGYTFNHKWQPRLAFEYNYGSGDSDSGDGTVRTFDNLYPTNHLFYGYIDFISLQNLNNYQFQISAKPHKKVKVQADLHLIYLDTPEDSWYSAGRTVTRTAAAGSNVSSQIGQEIDLTADYKLNNYAQFSLGYSHFFAGDYLRDTGANDDADFFYLQTTLSL